ncbi:DNA-processing protein DprA [uncultured Sulfitobacter sp.]|uniref:DNA-processing protein DprA n=1 Tax=uncultured Sulfitobacter sp. TaxID=191468 RepID=UPI00259717EA|nr:DNA-processing protein DprA [uncultured Sulfitobacter sp.]
MTDRNNTPSSSTPPLVPPTLEDDSFARLRLLRSRRVGVVTYYRMLRDYGTARAALEALPDVARAAGVKDYRICPENVVHAELRAAKAVNARLIAHDCAAYPPHLAELDDAPPFLWAIGDIELLHRPLVSIVGARNASSLGTRMARALASGLGEAGFTVVSGLARGIDAAAHLATLESGTIAVQAGGVDVIYPVENTTLAQDIAAQGLRISEQPMGLQPMARHFPSRNRIIAGLSRATVVVEAAAKSGSLITARDALDQGREVLAVPGHPFDARAAGCNMLIRDGAALVRNAADVIDQLGPAKAPAASPPISPAAAPAPQRDIAALHTDILSRLGPSPVAEDQLLRDLAVAPGIATPVLVELELNGHILRHAGGLVSRAD